MTGNWVFLFILLSGLSIMSAYDCNNLEKKNLKSRILLKTSSCTEDWERLENQTHLGLKPSLDPSDLDALCTGISSSHFAQMGAMRTACRPSRVEDAWKMLTAFLVTNKESIVWRQ